MRSVMAICISKFDLTSAITVQCDSEQVCIIYLIVVQRSMVTSDFHRPKELSHPIILGNGPFENEVFPLVFLIAQPLLEGRVFCFPAAL